MGVTFFTGRKRCLHPAFIREIKAAWDDGTQDDVIVLVPEQLTLETEIQLLRGLNLPGSFRLNVMSPKRLCDRVFDEAGRPDRVRVDERGRAMLMGYQLKTLKKQLKWYAGARDRRGFETRVVEEIIRMKQAGVTPDALFACAEAEEEGALKWKLHDLATLYSAYQEALKGKFQDGEDEMEEAMRRMGAVHKLSSARVMTYGFDITTPIHNRLLACLAGVCRSLSVYLPLENDEKARDFSLFLPLKASFERMTREMRNAELDIKRVHLADGSEPRNAAEHFAQEAYCLPAYVFSGKNTAFQMAALKNPMEEAQFAAALIRRLVMKNGWKYADITVLCENAPDYMDALESAFRAYGVPMFAAESRSADSHPLPRFLLESMKIVSGEKGSLGTLLLTGYTDLTDDEADYLLSYALRYNLSARELLKPLRRGDPEAVEKAEPMRKKLAEPLLRFGEAITDAKTLDDQLRAIFDYLTRLDCVSKGEASRERLISLGERTLAAEDAQVWNRLMGTLDQMSELMGEGKIPKAQLYDLLSRALNAAQIKPLPQSADAVNVVSAGRAGSAEMRALIVIGATAGGAASDDGLFAHNESERIAGRLDRFLGPDTLSKTRTDRMYMKNALSMAREYICVTYPMSAQDGSAVASGALVQEIKRIFPGLAVRGGITEDEAIRSLRFSAPEAAAMSAAVELSGGSLSKSARAAIGALSHSKEGVNTLYGLQTALTQTISSEEIGDALSRRVYGPLQKVSVTRLEAFAGCPFAHFVKYALKPEREETVELNARDEGNFYHDAVRRFLEDENSLLPTITPEEAVRRMNEISDDILSGALKEVVGDQSVARANARKMRRTAARAARTLSDQLRGSDFQPIELEMEFGETSASLRLSNANTRLEGRVDRIDMMEDCGERFLRVVDYKRSAQKPGAAEIYYGLQLQLILYLAEAIRKYGGKCAGAYYFCVKDPVVNTQSLDEGQIERERESLLRMEGILPNDLELIGHLAKEPEHVFRLKVLKSGELSAATNKATEEEFQKLIRKSLKNASEIVRAISKGVTSIEPVKTDSTDACRYCEYRGACMLDKRIPGGSGKRIRKMSMNEMFALIDEEEKKEET